MEKDDQRNIPFVSMENRHAENSDDPANKCNDDDADNYG